MPNMANGYPLIATSKIGCRSVWKWSGSEPAATQISITKQKELPCIFQFENARIFQLLFNQNQISKETSFMKNILSVIALAVMMSLCATSAFAQNRGEHGRVVGCESPKLNQGYVRGGYREGYRDYRV